MNKYGVCTTFDEVMERGYKNYDKHEEEGEIIANLIFRAWGKSMNLRCYFETDEGYKFYLLAFRVKGGERKGQYCPRDSGPNFATEKDNTKWIINIKTSRYGNQFWSTAEKIE